MRQKKKYMSKKDATSLFKALYCLSLPNADVPAVREAWNTFIDGEIRSGTVPPSAGNWSNPALVAADR